ncbi:sirohydrochlorin chelatase [Actinotalea sp. BY-33]|uniref:Sirohydrochlorin chelatase n=1 Tax=Actinotalea soli TaxID=2819234 RepID=A0A939LNL0_9CELL|nr:sirohydrochlorin chelatase [Actinotalea soli]MBO1750633.1 sirohydrochlorin chelatase [Actinotalea soli]
MPDPVLVGCSHGTDDPDGRLAVASILTEVRRRRPDLDVREAFVDVQRPEVADVVADAITETSRAGAPGTAVVVPLLLSAGFHVHVDIAAAVAGRTATASGALGPDPRLVEVLVDRLREVGATRGDAVVLAAAGSSDGRASLAVEDVAGLLRERWTEGPVTVGYGSSASPSVPEAVAAARAEGRRVVVAAYLLAPGFFHDRLRRAGADLLTDPLAPDPRLADVVLDRYACAARAVIGPCPGACPARSGCGRVRDLSVV